MLGSKLVLSEPEALQMEKRMQEFAAESDQPSDLSKELPGGNVSGYNVFWFDPANQVATVYLNAAASCCGVTPSTATVLRRLVSPAVIRTRDLAMSSCAAMYSIRAALAAPSTGGAANRIFTQPSCMPATSVLLARG